MIFLKLLGALALLMFGMKAMSDALQKMAGPSLRHVLGTMTTNRFTGLLTGMFVTVSVQSSAATTVMTVSFVNAGLLTLAQAISVIMGANIGTTLSAWIMSAGFSFNITSIVWPLFLLGIILIYTKNYRFLGDFLFGLAFLLFALGTLNLTGKEMNLAGNPAVVNFFSSFDAGSYLSILLFLVIGTILTVIAQSSAALMALTMVLCTSGVLPLYLGLALVLGENIGTTITANVVAMTANTQARRAAFSHLIFNVFGVTWVLCLFYPFVRFVCGFVNIDPAAASQDATRLSFGLAAFHTAFNVTNTFILIWFIPQIEKIVTRIIKPRKSELDNEFHLTYIQHGIIKTPEIAVLQAQKEISLYSDQTRHIFDVTKTMLKPDVDLIAVSNQVDALESMSDRMEIEVGKYLSDVSDAHLSDATKGKIRSMFRQINEMESIGDSCQDIAHILKRQAAGGEKLTKEVIAFVEDLFNVLTECLDNMDEVLKNPETDVDKDDRHKVKVKCNYLRERNVALSGAHAYSYIVSSLFNDLINESDELSGFIENVEQARRGGKFYSSKMD
ncbi:MAG: Na/Pi cotransporter family protein [Bacteroidales bacterium]|nr:Na/Pi cotransporter family protein [Bacteroidales bacterium]